jgi:hypothetical protein
VRLFLTFIGILLMATGLLIEGLFVFGHLASGVGLIDKYKDATIVLCGPLMFFAGLTSLLFGILGKGLLAIILTTTSMFVGISWTIFNFSYGK